MSIRRASGICETVKGILIVDSIEPTLIFISDISSFIKALERFFCTLVNSFQCITIYLHVQSIPTSLEITIGFPKRAALMKGILHVAQALRN